MARKYQVGEASPNSLAPKPMRQSFPFFSRAKGTLKPTNRTNNAKEVSEQFEGSTQSNKGSEANRTRKFTRKFGKVFVAQVLWGTFSVPNFLLQKQKCHSRSCLAPSQKKGCHSLLLERNARHTPVSEVGFSCAYRIKSFCGHLCLFYLLCCFQALRPLAVISLDLLAGVHICCSIDVKLGGEPSAKTNMYACVFRRVWPSL